MRVVQEIDSAHDFQFWSGAKDTYNRIAEIGLEDELWQLIEEVFEGEATDTEINDFVWFEDDAISEHFGFDFWKYDSAEEQEEAENEDDEDSDDEDGDDE
jgi:hypothetical protein